MSRTAPVAALMDQALVPGLQMAVIANGKVASVRALGVGNAESGTPVTEDTVFEAASVGKAVFAYGVLRLASEGRLDLDVPIGRYLPDLGKPAAGLTARQLLSHSAGLPNERSRDGRFTPRSPAGRFSYSGEGFRLLQIVVEKITGEPLNTYMSRSVFGPLQMPHSSYVWREDYVSSAAFGHGFTGNMAGRTRIPDARAQSSLQTSAGDLAHFLLAIVNGTGLKPEIARQMLQRQADVPEDCVICIGRTPGPPSKTISWGLGIALAETQLGRMAWHWGDNETMQAYAAVAVDGSRGLVVLTNSANGHSIIQEIARTTLGIEPPGYAWAGTYAEYTAPPRRLLSKIVHNGGGSITADDLRLPRAELQEVAERLIAGGRPKEADALLERLVMEGQSTADEWALLAEARRKAGSPQNSREAAETALRLAPQHKQAAKVIEKLTMAERKIPAEKLRAFTGRYSTPYGPLEIGMGGEGLVARLQDQPASAMLPLSDRTFLIEGMDLPIEFVAAPDGRVTHAVANAGAPITLPRIE